MHVQTPLQSSLRDASAASALSATPLDKLSVSLPEPTPANGLQAAAAEQSPGPSVPSATAPTANMGQQPHKPTAGLASAPSANRQYGTAASQASAPFDASQSAHPPSAPPTAGQMSASPSHQDNLSLSADIPAEHAHTNDLQDKLAKSTQASDVVSPFRTRAPAAAAMAATDPRPSPRASSGIQSVPGLPPAGQDQRPPLSSLKGISAATQSSMPAAAPNLQQGHQKAQNQHGSQAAAANANDVFGRISSTHPAQSANHPDKQAQVTCPGSVQGASTSAGSPSNISAPVQKTASYSSPDTVLAQGTAPAMAAAHQSSKPPSFPAQASHQNHPPGKADGKSALRLAKEPTRADLPAQPTSRPSMPTLTHGSAAAAGPSTFATSGATKGHPHQSSAVPVRTQQPAIVPRASHAAQTFTNAHVLTQDGTAAVAGAGPFACPDLSAGPPSHRNPTQQADAQLHVSLPTHAKPTASRPLEPMQHRKPTPARAAANAPSDTAPGASQREYPRRLSRTKQICPIRERRFRATDQLAPE